MRKRGFAICSLIVGHHYRSLTLSSTSRKCASTGYLLTVRARYKGSISQVDVDGNMRYDTYFLYNGPLLFPIIFIYYNLKKKRRIEKLKKKEKTPF